MKKTINFFLILLSSAILFSCSYDDDFLKEEIEKIKTEAQCGAETTVVEGSDEKPVAE